MLAGKVFQSFVVTLVIGCIFSLTGCVNHRTPAPVARYNTIIKKTDTRYIVRKGDTLYSIAWAAAKDYKYLATLNGIKPPYTIYPGKLLSLTKPRVTVKTKKTSISTKKSISLKKKYQANQKVTGKTSSNYQSSLKLRWKWPIKSKRVKKNSSKLGLLISGKAKQLVRSTERGKVVYAGNGLKGYGNLLIIKHNEEFLSAYGFNKRLLVREGESVKRGQVIAEIGLDKQKQYVLFFEIRRHGKAVVPTRYLPR